MSVPPLPSQCIPKYTHQCLPPPPPPSLLHQALDSGQHGAAASLAVSAVVITWLKLRFLIAPMRSYYLLIRSFWDQHQTDNNNKHSLQWNSVMTLPASRAMGRGIVWTWELQAMWGAFPGDLVVQLTSWWAPAWDFWPGEDPPQPARALKRLSWVVFPWDSGNFWRMAW